MTDQKSQLIKELLNRYGKVVERKQIKETVEELGFSWPRWIFLESKKVSRGTFDISGLSDSYKPAKVEPELSDKDLARKIAEKFEAMKVMAKAAAKGFTRSLIVSGPAGLGKTFEVMIAVKTAAEEKGYVFDEQRDKISGFVRPTGLYKALYEHQNENQILVFDDCDSIFFDDASLNLLKAACDTTEKRYISWRAETNMKDELGGEVPNYFEFRGTIIFITNYDFHALMAKGNKLAPHFEALISRSHYIDLEIKTTREKIIRIGQVIGDVCQGLSEVDQAEILAYITARKDELKDLSLRKVIKLGQLKQIAGNWKVLANTMS